MSCPMNAAAPLPRRRIPVDFHYDLICPWCMIGKRQLERAIDLVARYHPDVEIDVRWKSFPLLPELPPEGTPFQAFYLARLGSAAAVEARRRQVREAGRACGIRFDFERIAWMPNTIAAHALVERAGQIGGAALQSQLVDQLFQAYFQRGVHIGDRQALAEIGAICGMPRAASRACTEPSRHGHLLDRWLGEARQEGLQGVPGFVFGNRQSLSGALAPDVLAKAMLASLQA